MKLNKDFDSAIKDYRYLLNNGFPQKAIIKLVGDRYRLSSKERTMLYRGICNKQNCISRRSKLALTKDIRGSIIHIDAYNVLITIGSYLNGSAVFIGNDNFLRDAAEVHGKTVKKELLHRSISLTLDYIQKHKVPEVYFYLDSPVSNSGKLAQRLNDQLTNNNLQGNAQTVNSPDFILKEMNRDIISTSDSTIIDNCKVPVFDLARKVISYNFKPNFIRLR